MANTQETIADIIAEMKREAAQIFPALPIAVLKLATRFEAAWKRECELTKPAKNVNGGAASDTAGNCAKLREVISTLRTALKEIRNDILDMVINNKSEDPDSYTHGLLLSIGGACDIALYNTKEFANADE